MYKYSSDLSNVQRNSFIFPSNTGDWIPSTIVLCGVIAYSFGLVVLILISAVNQFGKGPPDSDTGTGLVLAWGILHGIPFLIQVIAMSFWFKEDIQDLSELFNPYCDSVYVTFISFLVEQFNDPDNFYLSAPCLTVRPLGPGVSMTLHKGIANDCLGYSCWLFIIGMAGAYAHAALRGRDDPPQAPEDMRQGACC
jgi:hypothetical protein